MFLREARTKRKRMSFLLIDLEQRKCREKHEPDLKKEEQRKA